MAVLEGTISETLAEANTYCYVFSAAEIRESAKGRKLSAPPRIRVRNKKLELSQGVECKWRQKKCGPLFAVMRPLIMRS